MDPPPSSALSLFILVQMMDISLTPALTLLDSVVRFGEYEAETRIEIKLCVNFFRCRLPPGHHLHRTRVEGYADYRTACVSSRQLWGKVDVDQSS